MCTYSLAQRPALSNCHLIPLLHTERWADVRGKVGVSLLVTGVFGNEVEVFAADDDGAVHFGADDSASEDTTADRDEASEGTLLVCAVNVLVLGLGTPLFSSFKLLETTRWPMFWDE